MRDFRNPDCLRSRVSYLYCIGLKNAREAQSVQNHFPVEPGNEEIVTI